MADERVMTFIDGSNLYHTLKNELGRTDLNFSAFVAKLVAGRRLIRSYYYNAPVDQSHEPTHYADQQRFFRMIQSQDYFELRLGRLVYRGWPTVTPYEKGIDVKLATDMLSHVFRGTCDTVILVSGDTDFADALQASKDAGVQTEVALFGYGGSQKLREVTDRVIHLDAGFFAGCWR